MKDKSNNVKQRISKGKSKQKERQRQRQRQRQKLNQKKSSHNNNNKQRSSSLLGKDRDYNPLTSHSNHYFNQNFDRKCQTPSLVGNYHSLINHNSNKKNMMSKSKQHYKQKQSQRKMQKQYNNYMKNVSTKHHQNQNAKNIQQSQLSGQKLYNYSNQNLNLNINSNKNNYNGYLTANSNQNCNSQNKNINKKQYFMKQLNKQRSIKSKSRNENYSSMNMYNNQLLSNIHQNRNSNNKFHNNTNNYNSSMLNYNYKKKQDLLLGNKGKLQKQKPYHNNHKQKSPPFKHKKERPISNLANARHAKHIQNQLSNLNDSIMKNQASFLQQSFNHHSHNHNHQNHYHNHQQYNSIFNQSFKKIKYDSHILKHLQDGKKFMKNNQFDKSQKIYQEILSSQSSVGGIPLSSQSQSQSQSQSHNKNYLQSLSNNNNNIQILYLLGVSKYHLQKYQQAIHLFNSVLSKDQLYRKNVYVFLAISYKKINEIQQSLLTLSKAITLFPKYYDPLIFRAKILSKQKRYYDAIQDLNKCIKIQPKNLQAYIYKADCLRSIGQSVEAIKIYTEILGVTSYNLDILLKRAITYIQFNDIQKALNDLNKIIQKNPINSQAYIFKGQAFTKTKNYNDAILAYQQAIKYNSSKRATTKALHQISKLKIDMGDFYGAAYNMQRASSLEVDMKILEKLKTFTEGSTFIMKKKYKKGIQNMNFLMKKEHLSQQIKPLIYSFRSYAYFCQYKFSNSLNDLKNLMKMGYKLDNASQYNYSLLEGILAAQNNNFIQARKKFQNASCLRNSFADPLIYLALANICEYNRNISSNKLNKKSVQVQTQRQKQKEAITSKDIKKSLQNLLKQAIQYINQSLIKQQHYNSYYLLACLYYQLQKYTQALQVLQKAIDKSDDHVMKHFYLRAMIKAMMGKHKYKQTLTDLNNVISLAKDFKDKQKERQRVSLSLSMNHQQNHQKNQNQHNQHNQHQQFQTNPQKEIIQTYLNRAKCYLLFDDKKKAFQDLQTYISCKPLDSQIHTVAGKLLFSIGACQDAVKAYNYSPNIQKNKQILLQRIKCNLVLKQLNLCLKDMQKMIDLQDSSIKYDFCCLSSLKQASKNSQENYKQAYNKIILIESLPNTIQNGHIFKKSDMLFFKGLYCFLKNNYQDAIRMFNQSKTIKSLNKQLIFINNKNHPSNSNNKFISYIGLQQRFQNNVYSSQEIQYNIAICQLLIGNYKNALKVLEKYQYFNQVVNALMKNVNLKGSSQIQKQKEKLDQQIKLNITPFPTTNRLCSIFPKFPLKISIPINNSKQQKQFNIQFGLSFCLPTVLPPQIKFQIQSKIIQDLNMSSTQARPDAPWIKRNSFGVIFTDQVIGFDIDLTTQQGSARDLRQNENDQDQDCSKKKHSYHLNNDNAIRIDGDYQQQQQQLQNSQQQYIDSQEQQFQQKIYKQNKKQKQFNQKHKNHYLHKHQNQILSNDLLDNQEEDNYQEDNYQEEDYLHDQKSKQFIIDSFKNNTNEQYSQKKKNNIKQFLALDNDIEAKLAKLIMKKKKDDI